VTWLNICQGLVLLGWAWRLLRGIMQSVLGIEPVKPTARAMAISAAVIIRSGAVSTIVGYP
jgi:hypothetical protein